MHFKKILAILAVLLTASTAAVAEDVSNDVLVTSLLGGQDTAMAVSAAADLRDELATADVEQVVALQSRLCQELSVTTDPVVMKRIAHVLNAAPSAEALRIGLTRLDRNLPTPVRIAACDLIAKAAGPQLSSDTAQAVEQLGGVLREDDAPSELIDGALLGMAAFGPEGLTAMLKVRTAAATVREKSNVFYSALGLTGDLRALPFLRDALTDRKVHTGLRIQAIHAMGQLAAAAAGRGEPIDAGEQDACVRILLKIGTATEDHQLYGVAVQALCRLEDIRQDPYVYALVAAGLSSSSPIRREAALQALYGSESQALDSSLLATVTELATTGETACKAAAQAVLDKYEAETEAAPVVQVP